MGEQQGMEEGYRILASIVAGLILYGGLGWLGDRLLHTAFLLPVGIVLGTVLSLYLVVLRHRRLDDGARTTHPEPVSGREEPQ